MRKCFLMRPLARKSAQVFSGAYARAKVCASVYWRVHLRKGVHTMPRYDKSSTARFVFCERSISSYLFIYLFIYLYIYLFLLLLLLLLFIYLFILFVSLPIFINAYQEYRRTRYRPNDRRVPDFNLKLRETICDKLNSMSIFSYTEVNEDVKSR